MNSYFFQKEYTKDILAAQIQAAQIPLVKITPKGGDKFMVITALELTSSQLKSLNEIVHGHRPSMALMESVTGKIMAARDFGVSLIARYGATNVLSGYSIEQIQQIMTVTAKVQAALNTGSLYVAISEINAIEPDEAGLITAEKLKDFRNQIEDYLQIPRT